MNMKQKIHISHLKSVLMIIVFVITTIPFAIAQHGGHGGGGGAPSSSQEEKVISYNYVCPMHPDVMSDNPGTCPKCGMNLERKKVAEGKLTSKNVYFTCSEHTKFESDKKGKCPQCGKKLKKKKIFSYE